MQLFDVYPRLERSPQRAQGAWLWDAAGRRYLDFYGGHAVISIGHGHPQYIERLHRQLASLAFYSNAVYMEIQEEYARKLGELSGYAEHRLFLCNSGAEANENALKLAALHTGRSVVVACAGAFHGRTAAAAAASWNAAGHAAAAGCPEIRFIPLNDTAALEKALEPGDVSAFIVEGIQGIAGIHPAAPEFLRSARLLCNRYGSTFILDEVQSGFARSGCFFAHQAAGITADVITCAKGIGNGFPLAAVLIGPEFRAQPGLLGSTFGGNPLACAAGLAVLEVIEREGLQQNAARRGADLYRELQSLPGVRAVRGSGLMLGVMMDFPIAELRTKLLLDEHIYTGSAACPHTLRLLPPLSIGEAECTYFIEAMQRATAHIQTAVIQ